MTDFGYLSAEDGAVAEDLALKIAAGTWVLFSGAGVSINSGLPSGPELVRRIEQELALSPTFSDSELPQACSRFVFEDGRGRTALIAFLRTQLDTSGRDPSVVHQRLLELAPSHLITTNPEDLWEKALHQRGIRFHKIVRNSDWATFSTEVLLIKAHGDFDAPDTLVFTEEDFARYPQEELIQSSIQALLAQRSFVFVGYSANDPDVNREIHWVATRLAGNSRPHYLITAHVPPYRRAQLRALGVLAIDVGDFGALPGFLADLARRAAEVRPAPSAPRIGVTVSLPALDESLLVELFSSRYDPIKSAIEQWRMGEAEGDLRQLIDHVRDLAIRRPDIAPLLGDFRQRMLLAFANILFWRSRRSDALAAWTDARQIGPFTERRREQAAGVAANLGQLDELAALIDEGLGSSRVTEKFRLILAALRNDHSPLLAAVGDTADDLDILLLKLDVMIERLEEPGFDRVLSMVGLAWTKSGRLPPSMLHVCQHTLLLLKKIVREGWALPGFDRRAFLASLRTRIAETVAAFEGLSLAYPEGLAQCLTVAISFHTYLDESEQANRYLLRLSGLPK